MFVSYSDCKSFKIYEALSYSRPVPDGLAPTQSRWCIQWWRPYRTVVRRPWASLPGRYGLPGCGWGWSPWRRGTWGRAGDPPLLHSALEHKAGGVIYILWRHYINKHWNKILHSVTLWGMANAWCWLEMCPQDTDAPTNVCWTHNWLNSQVWPLTLKFGASKCQGVQINMLTGTIESSADLGVIVWSSYGTTFGIQMDGH